MQRDFEKYNSARLLRSSGYSIRKIAKQLKISSSSASIWCRNIVLTPEQQRFLATKSGNSELLRTYAKARHEEKVLEHNRLERMAVNEIKSLGTNEFFIAGIALYWAEGFKNISEGRIGFCNSDPRMIKFMMQWFRLVLNVNNSDFILRVEFNHSHSTRVNEIENYWSGITAIPKAQFNKPFIQKTNLAKDYSSRGTYYGVLRIRIRKSSKLLVRMRGLIQGLSQAMPTKIV